ncbi:hypothetical protein P4V41_10225 [Fictibacillus nanhaiensis]|uniref:hypothetical protein n=1 Tax=Fictibacillus nanhaiensis TaxID=742169 RepID=UPI002E21A30B|nr:hypothetical protein [Fictibacillus nanhaiensis]
MEEDLQKVKQRIDQRLKQFDSQNKTDAPFNDAIDHYGKIEGYPTKNLFKVNMQGFPMPIRILGYFFVGTMGVGMITVLLLTLFK